MGQLKINSKNFVEDVRAGLTEFDLMKKYGLSERQLSVVYERLLDSGKLSSGDLEHQPQFEGTVVLASTCVACGALKFVDSGACPQCGMINPGTSSTAATAIGEPNSIVEGFKSRRALRDDSTLAETVVNDNTPQDTPFDPEAEPWEDLPRDELPTDSEFWADPATEELTPTSKIWAENHEDLLPSDEELWAGGPDLDFTGLSTPQTVDEAKVEQTKTETTVPDHAVRGAKARVSVDKSGSIAPAQLDRPLQDDGDATELLPVFHGRQITSGAAAGRKKIIGLAAALMVLAAVGAAAFLFFDDIAGLLSGGGPSPAQTAQVRQPAPKASPKKVEAPTRATQAPSSTQVAAKDEPIEQKTAVKSSAPSMQQSQEHSRGAKEPAAAKANEPEASPHPAQGQTEPAVTALREEAKPATLLSARPPVEAAKPKGANAELISAIDNEEVKSARSLLSLGADPNAEDGNGVSALLHAVGTGNESLVRLLVERGADVTRKSPDGATPLELALRNRDPRITRLILSRYPDKGTAGLLEAARKGDRDALKLLLEGGANVNAAGEMGETPLMIAAGAGQIETVRFLLEKGADPRLADKKGVNALGWARSPVSFGAVPLRVQREVVQVLKSYSSR